MSVSDETMMFKKIEEQPTTPADILADVYKSLKEKGYNPVNQLVGYLLSGDPTYITSYNNARSNIRRLERDEILEELVKQYIISKHS